jgi:tetratricopeptide (TPR) repeat protein
LSRPSSLRGLALVVPLLGAAGAAGLASGRWARAEAPAPRLSEAEVLERDLAFFERRVARDSCAAREHAQLARLHRQRAPAERLLGMDSTSRGARALLGEIQLEVGAYRDAARTFGSLLTVREELGIAPRYARWEEIRGRTAEARRLLRGALAEASRRHGMPRSQLAWFHWRLGDLALRHGRADEARRELEAGLELAPRDHRLLDGMARDGLHPTLAGYQVWADALRPLLTELLGPPASEDHAPPATGDPSAAQK